MNINPTWKLSILRQRLSFLYFFLYHSEGSVPHPDFNDGNNKEAKEDAESPLSGQGTSLSARLLSSPLESASIYFVPQISFLAVTPHRVYGLATAPH